MYIQTERVIFRKEKNPYAKDTPYYLAVFPDDKAIPGRLVCVPLYFNSNGDAIFEPCCEIDKAYYYSTHLVHRFDPEAPKLLKAITDYYSNEVPAKFRIIQKLPRWNI